MVERPLFLPLLGMVAGLCAAHHFGFFLSVPVLVFLLVASLAAIFPRHSLPFAAFIFFLFFVWGTVALKPFLAPVFPPEHLASQLGDEPVCVEGLIDRRPEADGAGERLSIQAERIVSRAGDRPASGRLLVFVREGRGGFLTGDRVRFVARLRAPENFGLPGEFDYRRHLAYRGVFVTAFVPRTDGIVLMREAVAFPVARRLDRLAVAAADFIRQRFPAEGGILGALLIGERGGVSDATEDAYARAGVNHILSISGFHVGVIAIALCQVLFRLLAAAGSLPLRLNARRAALLATLPPVVFYLLLSGAAPATVRSVIMLAAFTLAQVFERETDPLNTLLLAAMAILVVAPEALFDISFQLSFLALWGLVVLTPLLVPPLCKSRGAMLAKLSLFLAASVAATLVTLLPVAAVFHRASVAGIVANLLVVPLLGYGAVIAGFSALVLLPLSPTVAEFPMVVAAWLVRLADPVVVFMARIPPLPLRSVSPTELMVFYAGLTLLTFVRGGRAKWGIAVATAGIVIVMHLSASAGSSGMLRVTALSVGQGEAILVTLPDGKRMLVDGGGSLHEGGMDVGERLLVPALWSLGVHVIDYLVLTHPHPDHLKGLLAVATTFPIGEFWESGIASSSREYGMLRWLLADRGVPLHRIDARTPQFSAGGARVEPLAPFPQAEGEGDANEDSLVFRLTFGETAVLFTGDIGIAAEERLLTDPSRLRCTVFKVPHHGSRHSSSDRFLDAASPRIALISAGRRNSFGLPAPQTLDRLGNRRIAVYRTDRDGTIEVVCDGRSEVVRTFAQGHFH